MSDRKVMIIMKDYHKIIQEFYNETDNLNALLLIDIKGEVLASSDSKDCNTDVAKSIISSFVNIVKSNLTIFETEGVKDFVIKGKDGIIILYLINKNVVLVTQTNYNVELKMLIQKIKSVSSKIADLVERG